MGRSLVSSMTTVAAVLLLAACGGSGSTAGTSTTGATGRASNSASATSSSSSTASPAPHSDGGQAVSAAHDGFSTIIPSGYTNGLTAESVAKSIEYEAVGHRVNGSATRLTVYRGAADGESVAVIANRALRELRNRPTYLPRALGISSLHALSVDGAPALAVVYQLVRHKRNYRRQLFVVHDGWAYEINDAASPARYAESLRALDEVIRGWRWQ